MDIGINEKDRKKIAGGLSHLLADTYTLYLKPIIFTGMSPVRCLRPCI